MEHKISVISNGQFFYENNFGIRLDNRAFLYGDSLFETILASDMRLPFFDLHADRLKNAAEKMQFQLPSKFVEQKELLREEIVRLLNKNKHYKTAKVRLQVYRKPGGIYSPENNEIDYLIQTASLPELFPYRESGLTASVFTENKIMPTEFTPYKIGGNFRTHTLAGIYKKQLGVDAMILLNASNRVCEAETSNVYMLKDKVVYTPPVSDGCVSGISRSLMPVFAENLGLGFEEKGIYPEEFKSAEEIFISNAVQGVQSIKVLDRKPYFTFVGRRFAKAVFDDVVGRRL